MNRSYIETFSNLRHYVSPVTFWVTALYFSTRIGGQKE
jgi:hypothetical protein